MEVGQCDFFDILAEVDMATCFEDCLSVGGEME
jgi:hypothetical protein